MTTTAPQAIIEAIARTLNVPADTVILLFEFIDRLKGQHGERWQAAFPCELVELVRDGTPWATDVLGATAYMIQDTITNAELWDMSDTA